MCTEKKVKNVFIFVSDALRLDFLPEDIKNRGIFFKTAASSLYTASSFPSMLSGLYPPRHRVYNWNNVLEKNIKTLLDLKGFHTSLWCETTWTKTPPDQSGIHRLMNNPPGISLTEIKEPFVFVEDDKGGHCPFGVSFGQYMGGGCPDFFREYGKKGKKALVSQYQKGIEQSRKNFLKRVQVLKDRGIMDRTLIVFTSDHGELLGEYGGLTGHVRPPCPELVYVPTVFIHPSLEGKRPGSGFMRHVDLYPTVCGFLKVKGSEDLDGMDVLGSEKIPDYGFNFLLLKGVYKAQSVWDEKGGWIFHPFNYFKGLAYFLSRLKTKEFYFLLESIKNKNLLFRYRAVKSALRHLTRSALKYQKPGFSQKKAHVLLKLYIQKTGIQDSKKRRLSEKEKQQLKGLGYLD